VGCSTMPRQIALVMREDSIMETKPSSKDAERRHIYMEAVGKRNPQFRINRNKWLSPSHSRLWGLLPSVHLSIHILVSRGPCNSVGYM
jgi:hypothetical protein